MDREVSGQRRMKAGPVGIWRIMESSEDPSHRPQQGHRSSPALSAANRSAVVSRLSPVQENPLSSPQAAFWSLIKRGIFGSFHHVSKAYLPLYLNEFSFRHNNRENPDMFSTVVAGS